MAERTTKTVGEAVKHSAAQSLTALGRLHRFFRRLYKIVSSTLGLVIALAIYSFVGAAVFHAIEGRHETIEKRQIVATRDDIVNSTWANFSQAFDPSRQDEFVEYFTAQLKRYETELHEAFAHGINTESDVYVWDFWSAFLFCATVYTTIGYGHIAPATNAGKIVTMVYALFGIPLCLIVMAELGKKMTLALKFLWSFVRRFYRTGTCRRVRATKPVRVIEEMVERREGKKEERPMEKANEGEKPAKDDEEEEEEEKAKEGEKAEDGELEQTGYVIDDDFNLPPIIAVAITVAYICAGAGMYLKWESGWNYLDAFYFIFISISTVGFGDVLPEHPRYFLASSVYILLGLSLVAMVINVIMEVVSDTITRAKVKVIDVGHRIGIDLSPEDIDEGKSPEKESESSPTEK